jgi:hypothetical protein
MELSVAHKIAPGPPMDLANMRQNGVRSIAIGCINCGHKFIINMDSYRVVVLVANRSVFAG